MTAEKIQLTTTHIQGFEAFTLNNNLISLTIIPQLGGKLSSLRDLRTGREWLWHNSHLPYRQHPYGTSYVQEADSGGWDECFPTVAACTYPLAPYQNLPLPDHGEIWSNAWPTTISSDDTQYIIHSQTQGTALPYTFTRTITITTNSDQLHFSYTIHNPSNNPIAYIWSAHPLLAIEPGMHITLPNDTLMNVWFSLPDNLLTHASQHQWPVPFTHNQQNYDISTIPTSGVGWACKVWSHPLSQGLAELVATDGTFRFTFNPTEIPNFGIWLNPATWSGRDNQAPYYNLAFEPCIGAQDSLETAITQHQQYRILQPDEHHHWDLAVQLTANP